MVLVVEKIKVDVVLFATQPLVPPTNIEVAGAAPLPDEFAPLVFVNVNVGVAGEDSKSC